MWSSWNVASTRWGRLANVARARQIDVITARILADGQGPYRRALLIDAGCVWDTRTALRRAQAFAEFNIEWLEEPLREDNIDGYAWLRDRSPVPIASGEGECGREAFRPLLDRHALDVYQVDLSRNGFTGSCIRSATVVRVAAPTASLSRSIRADFSLTGSV